MFWWEVVFCQGIWKKRRISWNFPDHGFSLFNASRKKQTIRMFTLLYTFICQRAIKCVSQQIGEAFTYVILWSWEFGRQLLQATKIGWSVVIVHENCYLFRVPNWWPDGMRTIDDVGLLLPVPPDCTVLIA